MVLDLDRPVGLGGLIAHALLLHAWVEDSGTAMAIRATSPLYSPGDDDLFSRWFDRPAPHGSPIGHHAAEHVIWDRAPRHLPLARAERLFAKHFSPGARLKDALAGAEAEIGHFELAIHYRGTDKVLDSGRVAHAAMLDAAHEPLQSAAGSNVFLATDDASFAQALRTAYPAVRFASFDIGEVAEGQPRHFSALSPDDKAIEALVNIFMIARAKRVIRSSSYLSAMARLANPAQHTTTINSTLGHSQPFPEREILDEEQTISREMA